MASDISTTQLLKAASICHANGYHLLGEKIDKMIKPIASLESDNARLRAAIESAPHAIDCNVHNWGGMHKEHLCTCWKAAALNPKEQ